tara:strand:- start:9094 stop:10398 length:1305 start_codon:yes stop_codon:yes gene_type:complete
MKNLYILLSLLVIFCCTSKKNITKNNIIEYDLSKDVDVENNENLYYNLKTVLLHKEQDQLSLPIINLNSTEKLKLSFDDLNSEIKNLSITIEHCNYDWTTSNLMQSEYINGFVKDEIIDYEYSFNTMQEYIHYQYIFPSNILKPLISGNFKLKVFDINGDTLIVKKFMVLENKVNINLNIKQATLSSDRKTKHELDFIITHPNLIISDPFSQINVVIKQNNKDDNLINDLKPIYIRNNQLIYDYNEENTFFGNNEFRHFDIKSIRYHSDRIEEIISDSLNYNVYLFQDYKRSFNNYSIEPDLNGQFYIKSQEARNSDIEAEYVNVTFNLNSDFINYGNIYIVGQLTDWELKDDYKLKYDSNKKQYNTTVKIKQGYYNYHYAVDDTSMKHYDISSIEGTHYQTRNNYQIYVYYKGNGDRYERLIGFTKAISKELF